jgi:hypothetical protein
MTIWEWLTALLRRWPVLVIGMLCTMAAVYLVHKRAIVYESCASVIMAAPRSPQFPNIYADPNASLVVATGVISTQLMSGQMQQHFRANGLTADYQAQVHNTGTTETPAYSEPEMDVCSSSYSPTMSVRTTGAVLKEFGAILRQRQLAAHIKPEYRVTDVVIASTAALPVLGRPSQAYLGVGVLGLTCTAAAALWLDRYSRHRAQRRRAARRARAMAGRQANGERSRGGYAARGPDPQRY